MTPRGDVLHASAVSVDARGLLILGRSGSGKSTLALQLVALGATLVADDRVVVTPRPEDGGLILSAPPPIRGRIEARGVGLLTLPAGTARAFAAIDLDLGEEKRLPEPKTISVSGVSLPLIAGVETPALASILYLYLRTGSLER